MCLILYTTDMLPLIFFERVSQKCFENSDILLEAVITDNITVNILI